jgi:hypothetical protein
VSNVPGPLLKRTGDGRELNDPDVFRINHTLTPMPGKMVIPYLRANGRSVIDRAATDDKKARIIMNQIQVPIDELRTAIAETCGESLYVGNELVNWALRKLEAQGLIRLEGTGDSTICVSIS